jgi:hypothetical protein
MEGYSCLCTFMLFSLTSLTLKVVPIVVFIGGAGMLLGGYVSYKLGNDPGIWYGRPLYEYM